MMENLDAKLVTMLFPEEAFLHLMSLAPFSGSQQHKTKAIDTVFRRVFEHVRGPL